MMMLLLLLQYPLYSASVALYGGTFVGYNLCEAKVTAKRDAVERQNGTCFTSSVLFATLKDQSGFVCRLWSTI